MSASGARAADDGLEQAGSSQPTSILDLQTNSLVERVLRHRDRRCAELRDVVAGQVRELIGSARAEARARVHDAIVRERALLEREATQRQARAALEARRRAQQQTRALLERMWARIEGALTARWQADADRSAWIAAALSEAGLLLSGRDWTIEHGGGWSERDRESAAALAREGGARVLDWMLEDGIVAGLRVRAGPVVVDATPRGLLARREAIESAFLAECKDRE